MTKQELIDKIKFELVGIDKNELTTAEKNILRILRLEKSKGRDQ